MQLQRRTFLAAAGISVAAIALSSCAGDDEPGTSGASGATGGGTAATLVVDNSFDLKTADPHRQYEPTGAIVGKAIYQTLVTYENDDMTTPVPLLADFEQSDDFKTIVLTMKDGLKFSDGAAITVADALWSLQRVQGLQANPAFLLDGVTIVQTGDKEITLTTADAHPELLGILANTSLSILNSELVKANGGTTDSSDTAETFLNTTSAGSGPYILKSMAVASRVDLEANPNYTGTRGYDNVVLRNVVAATQLLNVQGGDSQIALDLSPDQASQLNAAQANLLASPSPTIIFLLVNQDEVVSKVTSKEGFAQAVRHAVNYERLVQLAGNGAVQAGGIMPSVVLGGLGTVGEFNKYDLEKAKAALAASGYDGSDIKLSYANDLSVQGIELGQFAAAIQSDLQAAGIKITLAPAPVATELDAYRNGKEEIGLWYWNPDYADPSGYLVFGPGELVGLRAGWPTEPKMDDAVAKARTAVGDARKGAYEDFQKALNEFGPFAPLLQPAKNVGYAKTIAEPILNNLWTIDVSLVKPA